MALTCADRFAHPPPTRLLPTTSSDQLAAVPLPLTTSSDQLAAVPLPLTTSSDQLAAVPLPLTTSSDQLAAVPLPLTTSSDQLTAVPLLPTTSSDQLAAIPLLLTTSSDQLAAVPLLPATSSDQLTAVPLPLTTSSDQLTAVPLLLTTSSDQLTAIKEFVPGLTDPPAPKRYKPTPSSATIKLPKISPFKLYSAEHEEKRAATLANSLTGIFEQNCIVSPRIPQKFKETFPIDIWKEILDHVDSRHDLFSLCLVSSNIYLLAIPHLYSILTVRSPHHYGEIKVDNANFWSTNQLYISPPNLIPFDKLLPPYVPEVVLEKKVGRQKRRRLSLPDADEEPAPIAASIPFPIWQSLRFVKDLRIEKWEGQEYPYEEPEPTDLNPLYPHRERGDPQDVFETYNQPDGIIELVMTRCEDGKFLDLQSLLAELLKSMPLLESFTYHPQRFMTFTVADLTSQEPGPEPEGFMNGITSELFAALKAHPTLERLKISFYVWDPFDVTSGLLRRGAPQTIERTYKPEVAGLVGFKNLRELVILGVTADERFLEIETVVKDCLFFNKPGRWLRRLEVRIEEGWYEVLQSTQRINPTQDLWDWALSLWGKCLGVAESFRYTHKRDSTHIDVLLGFGPIRWQFECPAGAGFVCRSDNLTALSLKGTHQKQILGAIRRLSKMGIRSLKVLAIECRLGVLNRLLKRFSGLKELYVFEPDGIETEEAREKFWAERKLSPLTTEAAQRKPIDLKGAQWTLDTICKNHLRTLEVLMIEEMVCPPHVNCTASTINGIRGWRERGAGLKELGVHLWGTWEDMSEFLTAFEDLRYLHLFNRPRSDAIVPAEDLPAYLQMLPEVLCNATRSFYNAQTIAFKIANLWGRDLICTRRKGRSGMLDLDRWIAVGPPYSEATIDWRWKWSINKAAKYVSWEDGPEFAGDAKDRPWEKRGRMAKVLREGEILKADPENYLAVEQLE